VRYVNRAELGGQGGEGVPHQLFDQVFQDVAVGMSPARRKV
jgi:hypothetical protein